MLSSSKVPFHECRIENTSFKSSACCSERLSVTSLASLLITGTILRATTSVTSYWIAPISQSVNFLPLAIPSLSISSMRRIRPGELAAAPISVIAWSVVCRLLAVAKNPFFGLRPLGIQLRSIVSPVQSNLVVVPSRTLEPMKGTFDLRTGTDMIKQYPMLPLVSAKTAFIPNPLYFANLSDLNSSNNLGMVFASIIVLISLPL